MSFLNLLASSPGYVARLGVASLQAVSGDPSDLPDSVVELAQNVTYTPDVGSGYDAGNVTDSLPSVVDSVKDDVGNAVDDVSRKGSEVVGAATGTLPGTDTGTAGGSASSNGTVSGYQTGDTSSHTPSHASRDPEMNTPDVSEYRKGGVDWDSMRMRATVALAGITGLTGIGLWYRSNRR